MSALIDFSNACIDDIPEQFAVDGIDVTTSLRPGPGLVLTVIATVLKVVDVAAHVLVATPAFKHGEEYASFAPGQFDAGTKLDVVANEV